jgi:hypothetical protein
MYTIEHHVGRLIETRIASPIELAELDMFRPTLRTAFIKLAGRRAVLVTDLTQVTTLPQDVADAFLSIMRLDNPAIERSAFLASDSATLALQVDRLIREANNPNRRMFRDPRLLHRWVGELLEPEEMLRVAMFFKLR